MIYLNNVVKLYLYGSSTNVVVFMPSSKDEEPGFEEGHDVQVVKTETVEHEFARIALTVPSELLKKVDEAAALYDVSRSRFIQDACREHVEKLTGTERLQRILLAKDQKYAGVRVRGRGIIVKTLIYHLSQDLETVDGNTFYLTPTHLQTLKNELEKQKSLIGRENKWQEFCRRLKLDPQKLPKDKTVKVTFKV